ncbi:MAG: septum formation inhibitor Maf [Lachnospiraceae bacterium]|nr:septum formation inhibitor Maf [Lachnospiraceae bacterium]
MRIILASASPRRRELLGQIGLEFDVLVSAVEEKSTSTEPWQIVEELAAQKADAVLETVLQRREASDAQETEELLVIGADTIVACDGRILGKPVSKEHAKEMLHNLSGRKHQVYTGVCLLHLTGNNKESRCFHEATQVQFFEMSGEEIDAYVATGDSLDKAGAYGIQGFCARYIRGIEGDYNNVVGLPVGRLYQEIKEYLS